MVTLEQVLALVMENTGETEQRRLAKELWPDDQAAGSDRLRRWLAEEAHPQWKDALLLLSRAGLLLEPPKELRSVAEIQADAARLRQAEKGTGLS